MNREEEWVGVKETVWIMTNLGWPFVFYIFGSLGLVWCISWHLLVSDWPEDHRSISPRELEYIRSGSPQAPRVTRTPWRKILSQAPVWTLIIVHFCNNWGFYIFLAWMPTYLVQVHGFSLKEMGIYAMIPYLAMVVGGNISAWLAAAIFLLGAVVWNVFSTGKQILE